MEATQVFKEVVAEMESQGIRVTEHPNGTVILRVNTGQLVIFPFVGKWKLQFSHFGVPGVSEAEYTHGELGDMTLRILRWGWSHGAKLS